MVKKHVLLRKANIKKQTVLVKSKVGNSECSNTRYNESQLTSIMTRTALKQSTVILTILSRPTFNISFCRLKDLNAIVILYWLLFNSILIIFSDMSIP